MELVHFCSEELIEATMGFVQVNLGDDFHWCVHTQNRNTDVDGVNIQCRDEFSNCAAAALVNFTQLAKLPYNVSVVEDTLLVNFALQSLVPLLPPAPVYFTTHTP